jgi:CheY-like chemotaxis protein
MSVRKVLLVEDNEFLRILYSNSLRHKKYAVDSAVDGVDALAKLKTYRPDLIVLDMIMPELNGIEVLKFFQSDPEHRDISILIFTAASDLNTIEECLEKGVRGYIITGGCPPYDITKQVHDVIGPAE